MELVLRAGGADRRKHPAPDQIALPLPLQLIVLLRAGPVHQVAIQPWIEIHSATSHNRTNILSRGIKLVQGKKSIENRPTIKNIPAAQTV